MRAALISLILSGVGKTDPVQFKGRFKQGSFCLLRWALYKQFSHLRYRIFISLEKGKFVFQKSLSEAPKKKHRTGSAFALPKIAITITAPNSSKSLYVIVMTCQVSHDEQIGINESKFFNFNYSTHKQFSPPVLHRASRSQAKRGPFSGFPITGWDSFWTNWLRQHYMHARVASQAGLV